MLGESKHTQIDRIYSGRDMNKISGFVKTNIKQKRGIGNSNKAQNVASRVTSRFGEKERDN